MRQHTHTHRVVHSLIRDEEKKTTTTTTTTVLCIRCLVTIISLSLLQSCAVANALATRHEPIYYRVTLSWKFLFSFFLFLALLSPFCERFALYSFARSKELDDVTI
jgi:hypothetical protein